jgi:hypothetical protein
MYTNLLSPLLYMPPIQVPIQEKCLLFMHIRYPKNTSPTLNPISHFVGLAYQGKDIVFRCIIEYMVA